MSDTSDGNKTNLHRPATNAGYSRAVENAFKTSECRHLVSLHRLNRNKNQNRELEKQSNERKNVMANHLCSGNASILSAGTWMQMESEVYACLGIFIHIYDLD